MARRRTSRRACRALRSRTASSLPRALGSSSAICSSLRTLAHKDLKGIAGPVRAWAALRPASVESRFEALHASGLTELVGREEELELLLRRWSKAKTGEGQVVLLSGEPGIGKSRLTAALLERLAAEPHTRLRNFCSPQHTDSAFYPIIGQMERAAGFTHDDTPQVETRQARCAARAELDVASGRCTICRNAVAAERRTLSGARTDPQNSGRQKTLEALVSQVEALARQNPVLMIFEDAHWIDPTSLEAVWSDRGQNTNPSRVADRHVSTGVRAAVDWTASRHRPHPQSARGARNRRHD